ncbi:MAG: hypothetical protein EOO88_54935, partial [Pedobacter sp.]
MDYNLEKSVWTDLDFDVMGWHDCSIYKYQLIDGRLKFDVDYIFEWVNPAYTGMPYTFWIAPATWVFHGVTDFELDLKLSNDWRLEIDDVTRETNDGKIEWDIGTRQGYFHFNADGFTKFVREKPTLQYSQQIPFNQRVWLSLEERTLEESNMRLPDEVVAQRVTQNRLYELALSRHVLTDRLRSIQTEHD